MNLIVLRAFAKSTPCSRDAMPENEARQWVPSGCAHSPRLSNVALQRLHSFQGLFNGSWKPKKKKALFMRAITKRILRKH